MTKKNLLSLRALRLLALAFFISAFGPEAFAGSSFAWCWSATMNPSDTVYFSSIFVTSSRQSDVNAAFGTYVTNTYQNPNTTGPGMCTLYDSRYPNNRAVAESELRLMRSNASQFNQQQVIDTGWSYTQ